MSLRIPARASAALALAFFALLAVPRAIAAQESEFPEGPFPAEDEPAADGCPEPGYLEVDGIGTPSEDFARAAVVAGVSPLRPQLIRRGSTERLLPMCGPAAGTPWRERVLPARERTGGAEVRMLAVQGRTFFNSGYPDTRNDGALWAGRGVSADLAAGVELRWGILSAAAAPVVLYQQNRAFQVDSVGDPAFSPFRNPWYFATSIDLPQRFGDGSSAALDPGQSYVRLQARGLAAGASTESLWWGPGVRNALLMSNTAPGFPHAYLGTARPLNVWIGRLEAQVLWGHLRESAYFDTIAANDRNLFTGIAGTFEPRGLPGLYLGMARVYVHGLPPGGLPLRQYFVPLLEPFFKHRLATPDNPTGTRPDNQLVSLFARWVLPESGFEAYGEWAREDHSRDLQDLLQEPDHSQGFTLGFQKVTPAGQRWFRLRGELTNLHKHTLSKGRRAPVSYYTHGDILQGYTHRGQLLGAGIGPGADSQYLGADLFTARGRIGVYAERIRRNEGVYYRRVPLLRDDHDVEVAGGLRHALLLSAVELEWGAAYAFRWNRDFLRDEGNWRLDTAVRWRPGSRRSR